MLHRNRRWSVADVGPSKLADSLTRFGFTSCTGFRCNGYLWLNDSTGPDRLQEYAIVRETDGAQVESITVSWCTVEEILNYVAAFETNGQSMDPLGRWRLQPRNLEHGGIEWEGNRCALCA